MIKIDWHPYPQKKPALYVLVLVTIEFSKDLRKVSVDYLTPIEGWWKHCLGERVIAWAELPEPYRPEVKNETHE